jgi:hypothetical protein
MGKTKHLAPWWSVDAQIDGPRTPGVDPDERGSATGVGSLPIRLAAKGIVRAVRMGAQEERHQAMASVSPILVDRLLAISRALAGHVDPGAAFRATAVEIETLIPHAHMDVAVLLDEGRSHACYEAPHKGVHLSRRACRPGQHQGLDSGARTDRHRGFSLARLAVHLRNLAPPGRNTDSRAAEARGMEDRSDGRALRARGARCLARRGQPA